MNNTDKETEYKVYDEDGSLTECADIDDMTNLANAMLNRGHKELRIVIAD
jgi:hypothetical protein